METKEYIVILEKGIDYAEFWREMETTGATSSYVPSRPVAIVDEREAMDRMCVYALSDNDAELLRNDPRVKAVEIPIENCNDWEIVPRGTQVANFNKPNTASGTNKNWGLIRHNYTTNVYGTSTTTNLNYNYLLDGSNVDVVIMDTGIQANHPEWQNTNGVSRFKPINWFTATGIAGRQPAGFYTDVNGHGTFCAGVAVGKTFGWAKNANIYSMTTYGNPGNNISFTTAVALLKKWHQDKLPNPATGVKNPTVVNMSFGLTWTGSNYNYTFNFITYRNQRVSPPSPTFVPGDLFPNYTYGMVFYGGKLGRASIEYDTAVQELLDVGIVVCIASGNDKQKVDRPGGVDYNNSINIISRPPGSTIPTTYYYMQGDSPYDADAVYVGAIDSTPASATTDQKALFSRAGPAVEIFAAGANVMSSMSTTNTFGSSVAPYNNNDPVFKQALSEGTSFAAPQIVGMAALYLQAKPTATPAQVKSWLMSNSVTSTLYNTGLTNDYINQRSQWGGNAGVAFQSMQGLGFANNGGWKQIANVYVKGASSWQPVRAAYIKTTSGWTQVF
jgi:subtilisin family serine protease